jgi:hypothetical protein
MVPGAAILKLLKMQLKKLDYMHIEIEDRRNVNLGVFGLFVLMQLRGDMAFPIHSLSQR